MLEAYLYEGTLKANVNVERRLLIFTNVLAIIAKNTGSVAEFMFA